MTQRGSHIRTVATVVSETIERHGLLDSREHVHVAFSGGADSTALSVILISLGYTVTLVHVDHGMRPTSGSDAVECEKIASRLGIPFIARKVTVDPQTEQAARNARYAALGQVADDLGVTKIATGHTMDDQAETVLMRLARGGFAKGIPYRRGNIVRPLLDLRRSDTEAVCRAEGLVPLKDPSNLETRFTRNLIRNDVLPRFPDDSVVELARLGKSAEAAADSMAERLSDFASSSVHLDDSTAWIDRKSLQSLDNSTARGLVRLTLERLGIVATSRLIADVVAKVLPVTGASLDLPGGFVVTAEPIRLVVGPRAVDRQAAPVKLAIPGTAALTQWAVVLSSELVPPEDAPAPGPWLAILDEGIAGKTALVRARRSGDRLHPVGMKGAKKLQDLFVDAKVPKAERDFVPILTIDDEIAWVVGHRVDRRFVPAPGAKFVVVIKVSRLASD